MHIPFQWVEGLLPTEKRLVREKKQELRELHEKKKLGKEKLNGTVSRGRALHRDDILNKGSSLSTLDVSIPLLKQVMEWMGLYLPQVGWENCRTQETSPSAWPAAPYPI